MADIYTVKMTDQAQRQLREIVSYISHELQAPDAARNLLNALENQTASLRNFPQRISLTSEEPWRSYGVRRMPVKNFLVYFWIDEDSYSVQITAVLYSKRNQIPFLSQMIIN